MKKFVILGTLLFCSIPVIAHSSAENLLKKASDLETWRQQLRYYEQQLAGREETVFGKLEVLQQQYQQGMQQAAGRENALRRQLRQQQENAGNRAFQTELQQQQKEARQREAALQRQLEEQRARTAYARLQQGMRSSTLQNLLQDRQSQASGQGPQQEKSSGDADKRIPRESPTHAESVSGWTQPALPPAHPQPSTHIVIFEAPIPIATVAALESKIDTTVNGIDNIETKAILPENLSVEQLEAVKKITDNGTLIAQQRLGLEQFQLDTSTQLSRLRVVKGLVLWGLLFSIPTLLTLYWIVRNIALGWREWQQEKLSYTLKELERVERHIIGTE